MIKIQYKIVKIYKKAKFLRKVFNVYNKMCSKN